MRSHSDLNIPLTGFIRACGAIALLLTLTLVSLSAIGRNIGFPLPGTIEIVEIMILITAAAGILTATIERAHAAAHLIIEHLSAPLKHVIEQIGTVLGFIFCLAVTIGNAWLLYDVWYLHEASHLLGIPIVPLRIVFVITMSCTCLILLSQLRTKR